MFLGLRIGAIYTILYIECVFINDICTEIVRFTG